MRHKLIQNHCWIYGSFVGIYFLNQWITKGYSLSVEGSTPPSVNSIKHEVYLMGFLWTLRWDNAQKGSVQALLAWGKWYRAQSRNRLSRIQHKMRGRPTPFDHTLCLLSLDQFSSVTQLCPSLCDPMNRSTPGLPVSLSLSLSIYIYIYIFLPGEFYGQKSLADYSPWGHKQWGMTEQVTLHVKGTFKGESGNRNTSALNGKALFSSSYHSTLHNQWKTSGHAKPRQC